ncbi:MAG: leucyl aminopeptidase family protein [Pseudomonadota bacterium]
MPLQLPASPRIEATHHRSPLSEADIAQCDHLVIALPSSTAQGDGWPEFPHQSLVRSLLERLTEVGEARRVHAVLPNANATGLSAGFVPAGEDAFASLTAARKLVADVARQQVARVAVVAPGFSAQEQAQVLSAIVRSLAAAAFEMPSAKQAPRSDSNRVLLEHIDTFSPTQTLDYRRELAEAQGNGLARWLSALPSNALTVQGYLERVETLAGELGWELEVLRTQELEALGANAYLAVAQGSRGHSPSEPALIHLRYRPPGGSVPNAPAELALVGKGICFDTGGVNVKPAQYMQTMNEDMGGSAAALGTLYTITELGLPIAVDAWLALAENAIGPAAYKPQDLITAANGTTIEVVHTDAEGRMVLADTLHLAAREQPALLVDLATLTGACVNALTTAYSGVFVNRPELQDMLVEAGRSSGERVWPFPLSADFDHALESDFADVKQCTIDGRGDHILAARFLGRFVPDSIPWVHIDLAASRHKGGLGHVPTDVTGFGVHLLTSLLVDQMLTSADEDGQAF